MTVKLIGLSAVLSVGLVWADVEHRDSKQLSYSIAGDGKLIVDNITGGIRVTAHAGREVRIAVREHWEADTAEKLAQAQREVRLDASQSGNTVRLYVDGPFRCCRGGVHFHDDPGYRVRYDFEIQVPADTALELKTINGGGITAQGTTQGFQVSNVNGSIELTNVAGSGMARTVNGRVHISFARNPSAALSCKTVNGEVAVEFQPGLSGDFRFKTLNGDAYTDFDVSTLPGEAVRVEKIGAKASYRLNHFSGVRVGAPGGPEHRFETLNGNIRILRRGK